MKQEIKVEICGKSYTIKGEEEEDYILRLAHYVDKKMREVSQASAPVPSLNTAVLAALTIADELFKLREEMSAHGALVEERMSHLLDILEKA